MESSCIFQEKQHEPLFKNYCDPKHSSKNNFKSVLTRSPGKLIAKVTEDKTSSLKTSLLNFNA